MYFNVAICIIFIYANLHTQQHWEYKPPAEKNFVYCAIAMCGVVSMNASTNDDFQPNRSMLIYYVHKVKKAQYRNVYSEISVCHRLMILPFVFNRRSMVCHMCAMVNTST